MVVALGRVDGVGILAVFLIELDCCGGGRFDGYESSEAILGGNVVEFGGVECLGNRDFHAGSVAFARQFDKLRSLMTALTGVSHSCKFPLRDIDMTLLPMMISCNHTSTLQLLSSPRDTYSGVSLPCETSRHCGLN